MIPRCSLSSCHTVGVSLRRGFVLENRLVALRHDTVLISSHTAGE